MAIVPYYRVDGDLNSVQRYAPYNSLCDKTESHSYTSLLLLQFLSAPSYSLYLLYCDHVHALSGLVHSFCDQSCSA